MIRECCSATLQMSFPFSLTAVGSTHSVMSSLIVVASSLTRRQVYPLVKQHCPSSSANSQGRCLDDSWWCPDPVNTINGFSNGIALARSRIGPSPSEYKKLEFSRATLQLKRCSSFYFLNALSEVKKKLLALKKISINDRLQLKSSDKFRKIILQIFVWVFRDQFKTGDT